MKKLNLKDVKYMHYLDYRLNNTPMGLRRFSGQRYPRLVDYLFDVKYAQSNLDSAQTKARKNNLYRALWREGLFRSCQA